MKQISVIIPCYFSEKNIGSIIESTMNTLEGNYSYEIILVDDGSKDNTYNVIKSYQKLNENIFCVRFSKNYGQHSALLAGYSLSNGNIVVGLNDDGEHDPKDMIKLIEKINDGFDYVCAKHALVDHGLINTLGSRFNNFCNIHLLNQPRDYYFSSYYAMSRFLVDRIIENKNPFININGLILTITDNLGSVDIPTYKRKYGNSGYSLKKSLQLWGNTYTSYTLFPLRLGYYLFIISIILMILYFSNFVLSLSNESMMMSIILFFFSAVLLLISILGEYIGRTYLIVNGKKPYNIRDISYKEKEED